MNLIVDAEGITVTKWLIEARQDYGRRFSWISIPGVASIVYWVKTLIGTTLVRA